MHNSFSLGRIKNIEIKIHFSWFLILFLIVWSLADFYFPANYPGWSQMAYWISGGVAAFLLFVSVLLHEFSHSLIGKRKNIIVKSITLFVFGGVAEMVSEPKKPADEFDMAIAGPLASIVLAGVFMSFGAEILSGANPGVFVLSFLAAALIFFIAVKFIILGQDGIFSRSAKVYFQKLIVTIGIFIVFALLSILINNLLYAANGYFLLISAMAVNAKMIVYIIVWSAIFTVLLNRKKPNAESRFLNSLF